MGEGEGGREREGGEGEGGEGEGHWKGVSPEKSHKAHNMLYRIQNSIYSCSKTHVHKITNVPVFLYGT